MQRLERLNLSDEPSAQLQELHPLVNFMWERNRAGSVRGERNDGRTVALAIEGGGHAGVVSAGMCVVLEATGLIDAVDVIYGTSSGALNGSFTATGQAAIGSTNYEDTANRRFSNPMRLLRGKSVIDFDFLFDDVIRNRKPYDPSGLETGPEFCAVTTNLDTREPETLKSFVGVEDLMQAVRVSCSIPFLSRAVSYKGKHLADGGLTASVPYKAAISEGATDVLALRTKSAAYRIEPYSPKMINWISRLDPIIAELLEARPEIYNADAEYLESLDRSNGNITQIAIPDNSVKVSRLEHSVANVRKGLHIGAAAAAAVFGLSEIDVLWQPSIHLT
jgi:predicted patatin/cPLA2 family phospholipase